MSSFTLTLLIITVGLCFFVASTFLERKRLRVFWNRPCAGSVWKRSYPYASKEEIRHFLSLFTNSFGFKKSRQLCFYPTDKILSIYQALYPPGRTIADTCELERLIDYLQRDYRLDLESVWHENMTLGELFETARSTLNERN